VKKKKEAVYQDGSHTGEVNQLKGYKKSVLKAVLKDVEEVLTIQEEGNIIKASISNRDFVMDAMKIGEHTYSIIMNGRVFEVQIDEMDRGRYAVYIGNGVSEVNIFLPKSVHREEGIQGSSEGVFDVRSPMPGKIVRIFVRNGEGVKRDTPVLTMEAMKMENEIRSPVDGIIDGIFVQAGQIIEGNILLFRVKR